MTGTRAGRRARLALAVAIVVFGILGGLRTDASGATANASVRGIVVAASASGVDHATAAIAQPSAPSAAALAIALGGLVATPLLAAWPGVLAARGPSAVPATVGARWRRRGPPR